MQGFKTWIEKFDFEDHPLMPHLVQTSLDRKGKHKVLIVDVQKFDKAWSKDSNMYLPPGGTGDNYIPIYDKTKPQGYNRYHRVGEEAPLFKKSDKDFDMPTVGLKSGIPNFIDGRHRFAYFRDLGIKSLPVSVPIEDYAQMKKLLGISQQ
jgi:hypothetical protein